MNVVDSSAWLAYFADSKNADYFAQAIEDTDMLLVPSITLTEVFKHVLRHSDENQALQVIGHMQQGRVVPLDSHIAISAANVGIEYKLPLADSVIFATAQHYKATIWTQDADFADLPNVRYKN